MFTIPIIPYHIKQNENLIFKHFVQSANKYTHFFIVFLKGKGEEDHSKLTVYDPHDRERSKEEAHH